MARTMASKTVTLWDLKQKDYEREERAIAREQKQAKKEKAYRDAANAAEV